MHMKRNPIVTRLSMFAWGALSLSACSITQMPSQASQTGDGGTTDTLVWPAPKTTPTPKDGVPRAMSCAWLESNNCWKAIVQKLEETCAPDGLGKAVSKDPRKIEYPDGSKALSNSLLGVSSMGESQAIPNIFFSNPDGTRCGAIRVGYPFTAIEVGDDVVLAQNFGYSVASVVCQDGTTYGGGSSETDKQCEDLSARTLKGEAPEMLEVCTQSECVIKLSGGPKGRSQFGAYAL
jgi:hypothetical protein